MYNFRIKLEMCKCFGIITLELKKNVRQIYKTTFKPVYLNKKFYIQSLYHNYW